MIVKQVWCLICAQRPAEGVIRRVYMHSGDVVVVSPNQPVPRICQVCADEHHQTPAKPERGSNTFWEFVLSAATA